MSYLFQSGASFGPLVVWLSWVLFLVYATTAISITDRTFHFMDLESPGVFRSAFIRWNLLFTLGYSGGGFFLPYWVGREHYDDGKVFSMVIAMEVLVLSMIQMCQDSVFPEDRVLIRKHAVRGGIEREYVWYD